MKKLIIYIILIFISTAAFSQQPFGNLYFNSYADWQSGADYGILGYISYPSNQFNFIDSSTAKDFTIYDSKLFTVDSSVNVYNLSTNQIISSHPSISGHLIGAHNGFLFVGDYQPPHIKVYDINNNLAPVFSIDTPIIVDSPIDITFSNGRAYTTGYYMSYVIDINIQDTLCTLKDTNAFTYYQACENNGNYIYLLTAWPTGAPHEGLSRMDKLTKQVDVLIPVSFKPTFGENMVFADDKLYLWWYPTFYDITNDSLHIDYYIQTNEKTFAYDSASTALFTAKNMLPNGEQIRYYVNNLLIDSIFINNELIRTIWKADATNSVLELQTFPFLIYPNPVSNKLHIESTIEKPIKQINLIDLNGKIIQKILGVKNKTKIEILISNLNKGIYNLEIFTDKQNFSYPIIKD